MTFCVLICLEMKTQHVLLNDSQQKERDIDGRNTYFIRWTKYGTVGLENIRAAAAGASSGRRTDAGRICSENWAVQADP